MSQIIEIKLVGAAIVGCTTLALMKYIFSGSERRQKETEQCDEGDQTIGFIRLNAFEDVCVTKGAAPISTITWFEGDHEQSSLVVKKRFQDVILANPWLSGCFMKGANGKNYIAYCANDSGENPSSVDLKQFRSGINMFTHAQSTESTLNRESNDVLKAAHCFLLKMHHDFKQPLIRVSIVPSSTSPSSSFALIVSMSHGAGDGHTFYEIHNMLVGAIPARSMIRENIVKTDNQQMMIMGKTEKEILSSAGFIICAIRGVLYKMIIDPLFGSKGKTVCRYFLVDAEKMKELKKHAALDSGVSFCSTNDVISSWYFANCKVVHGLMAINFRNRLEGHTDNHAGNYENMIYYRNMEDAATPGLIRKSLSKLKRCVTHESPPNSWEIGFSTLALNTNWASFHSNQTDIPGCRPIIHLPIYDWEQTLPSTFSVCVIFQARPNQLAVCIAGTPEKMEFLANAPFEAEGDLSQI